MYALLLFPLSALAAEKTVDDFKVAVTASPIHLTIPLLEVTGEVKLAPKISAALIAGYGIPDGTDSVIELGAQGRYYVLGDFRSGLQLGAEAIYLRVSASDSGVTATGSGATFGPFVGGKWTADIGFTVDGQVGVQWSGISASATDGETTASASESDMSPLININLGWSF
ncbi:MAG: hypothetical protein ACI8S6_002567 [Myxococcota bacterium]|jgi:hypothetical protein